MILLRKIMGIFISVLIFGLIVNPALASGEVTQGTNAELKTYEIEIYGVPAKVTIAENSILNVAYLAINRVYGATNITTPEKPNEKGPDFPYVKIPNIPLTKWEAKGTTVFRVTTLIRDGYNRNLEGQPGIVSVYRMKGSNLYVAFIHG
ncbi:MAG: hypothetical protein J7K57_06035 [Palaeococcus sp.]|uniref:hypothetical protein n=1 Tax=Palaeococcus sp. (in: euryarchaeotes) TaxID=2820298 RepID=UPI0025DAFC0D|nr:hypothetical protein [Palaeococcus sp. (in: euryarchaeotes)]MCD6559415.1 hypothetical protein [Palaeococcus sp. (in: euryarchaeotes)]